MVSESVYVTVAIACVVTLLIVAVIVIYCIKRQQDKEQWRQAQEERARLERHRRQLRGNVVRPPPYCPRRQSIPQVQYSAPFTPPPAYKETASPIPPSTHSVGIGGPAYPPPNYEPMPAVGQSVPPSTTAYNQHSQQNYMQQSPSNRSGAAPPYHSQHNYMQQSPGSRSGAAPPYHSGSVSVASRRTSSEEVAAGSTPGIQTHTTPRASEVATGGRRSLEFQSNNQTTIHSNQTHRTSRHEISTNHTQLSSISTTQDSVYQETGRETFNRNSTSTNQRSETSIPLTEQRTNQNSNELANRESRGVTLAVHVGPARNMSNSSTAAATTTRRSVAQTRVNTSNIEDLSLI